MKILWVTSQVLSYVAEDLNICTTGFGGWVTNMINELRNINDIQIGIVMVSKNIEAMKIIKKNNLICYVAKDIGAKEINEKDMKFVIDDFQPNLIHIEGNEFPIHNSFAKIRNIPVLLSLQGILSGYEPYQYGELPIADYMFEFFSYKSMVAWILFFRKHFCFDKRIKTEIDTIKNVKYIAGRTFWDRAHSFWINTNATYYSCNRILRPKFYTSKWNYNNSNKNSIFVGNGYSPLKGLHNVIEAVALLKKEFPDIKVYVAGNSPIITNKVFSIKKMGYSKYIKKLIKKYNLEKNIIFTGTLNEEQMVEKMLQCNVYVLPSLIENSPNTLGEAMIIGMPCVSAYTGGASEMAMDEKECLFYRANDYKLLAWQLRRVFIDEDLCVKLGENARNHALITHDPIRNRDTLIEIYKNILNNERD